MNDSGNPDPEYWKKSPRESGAKQANRYLDEMKGKWNQYKSMSAGSGNRSKKHLLLRHHCTPLFTMDIATAVRLARSKPGVTIGWAKPGVTTTTPHTVHKALFQVRTDLN